ncbi:Glutamyl-tRNA synthetase [alpha proteobacterium BAL199]|jgi:glutamyl-tRNA synthetase|nr:Glutamyl-tRNA synthetase [alpha proteobacterium BAL199]
MTVVTRFAPSPTGYLHIGGARTALFNWLFSRHHGGTYRLRIEDTDRQRSTKEAVGAILDGLNWLGLSGDGEIVFQSERAPRHAEVAYALLEQGKAYRCYCSPEELAAMRDAAKAEGRSIRYDGRWRDRDPADAPPGVDPVIRIKAPLDGEMTIADAVQGNVTVPHSQLDDMILLRADGSPTYMHSVVVDDHDMGITHVIRGDDHLNNAFRQSLIYQAMGWNLPVFAHIPLIHGADGAKFSKRHGALGVDAYRDMGYLPEAMQNYLLRLGWGHGDDEIISAEQAIEWFDLDGIGRAASRFDFDKLGSVNGHYIREADDDRLTGLVAEKLAADPTLTIDAEARRRVRAGMAGLKERAKTIVELAEKARFYVAPLPLVIEPKAAAHLDESGLTALAGLAPHLEALTSFDEAAIEGAVRRYAEESNLKLGKVAQPLRAAVTGSTTSPGIFEVLAALGKSESLQRINAVCAVHTNG